MSFPPERPIPYHLDRQFKAAKDVIDVLRTLGFAAALVGGMACWLYGNPRSPNDIDLLLIPPPRNTILEEELKRKIVNLQPDKFLLRNPITPGATFKKLFHRGTFFGPSTKIDILYPGVMNLPAIKESDVVQASGFPVAPLGMILLFKLQAWQDHRLSLKPHFLAKVPIDANDIEFLLGLEPSKYTIPRSARGLHTEEFRQSSGQRVILFCRTYPHLTHLWRSLLSAKVL